MRPLFMITIRSAIVIASSWSCVTWTNVIPTSCWIRFSSSCISLRSLRSSAPSGSSRRSTRGRFTSARASAIRCCWPPESCRGLRRSSPARPTSSSASMTRAAQVAPLHAAAPQPEGDVLEDREMREERVRLEDGVHVALVRRQRRHVDAAELDPPLGRLLEAADHPQRRRLAAARRPEQREEAGRGRCRARCRRRRRRRRSASSARSAGCRTRSSRAVPQVLEPLRRVNRSCSHASVRTSPRIPVISSNSACVATSGGEIWTTGSPRSSARQISPFSNSRGDRKPRSSVSHSSSENVSRVSLSFTSSSA